MKATAALKAADRNPYSWNMEFYEYPAGSGYEGRFTKCGICVLMKELGLYDLTPALCHLDYTMSEAGAATNFVRQYTLASGGPYLSLIHIFSMWSIWPHGCRAVKISSTPILSLRYRIRSMCPVPKSIFFTP